MSPKLKYTQKQLIDSALKGVSQKGIDAVTAEVFGNALYTSAAPLILCSKYKLLLRQQKCAIFLKKSQLILNYLQYAKLFLSNCHSDN